MPLSGFLVGSGSLWELSPTVPLTLRHPEWPVEVCVNAFPRRVSVVNATGLQAVGGPVSGPLVAPGLVMLTHAGTRATY